MKFLGGWSATLTQCGYFRVARHPRATRASAEFPISHTVPRRSQRDFSCSFKGVQPGTVVGRMLSEICASGGV
jgi:hypothetical protein